MVKYMLRLPHEHVPMKNLWITKLNQTHPKIIASPYDSFMYAMDHIPWLGIELSEPSRFTKFDDVDP